MDILRLSPVEIKLWQRALSASYRCPHINTMVTLQTGRPTVTFNRALMSFWRSFTVSDLCSHDLNRKEGVCTSSQL